MHLFAEKRDAFIRSSARVFHALFITFFVCLVFFMTATFHVSDARAATACSASAAAQNGITVVPSHGQAFLLIPVLHQLWMQDMLDIA